MSRSLAVVGVLLLASAGCSLTPFLAPSPDQQVVSDSLERVAARIQDGLSEAGVPVLSKRVGTEVRLAGMTKSGKVFCLHLYAKKVEGADKTLVRVRWDREADEPFWQSVLRIMTAGPDSPSEAGDADGPI
jgi:hypothetical protein